jgi:hypothetical protein
VLGPRRVTRSRPHRPELEDRELGPAFADAPLPVEDRPAVSDHVEHDHERDGDDQQHRPDQPEHHIEKAFHPGVDRGVQLLDVEHERHPLELAEWQLAEPLFVEQRQRPHPGAARVKHCHLRDHRLGGLCFAVEHDQGRPVRDGGFFDPPRCGHGGVELCEVERGDKRRWTLGRSLHVRSERLDVVSARDDEHAVAHFVVAPYVLARNSEHRVRGDEDDHGSEDHEPGEHARADHELDQRHADRCRRYRQRCGHPRSENRPRKVGQPDSVRG